MKLQMIWVRLSQAQTEARAAAMAARRAACVLQDAFSVWTAYAAAMSDATPVRAGDAFLAPRDSQARLGSYVACRVTCVRGVTLHAAAAHHLQADWSMAQHMLLTCTWSGDSAAHDDARLRTACQSRLTCLFCAGPQRDRDVVTHLAAMLSNTSARSSASASASDSGAAVPDARRFAYRYLR